MSLPPVNPGFALLLAAVVAPLAPRALRGPVIVAAAVLALALPFASEFGAYARFAQLGVELTPLRLDPLSQVFGLGAGLAALATLLAGLTRPDPLRDAAVLALFGGGLGAIYAGDLVSFTALLECASLAAAALVFAGGGAQARRASVAVLTWQSVGGGFLVIGAGLVWGQTGSSLMRYLPISQIGPLLVCLGLAIKVAVAPAHLWLRAAAAHAPPLGLAAILGVGLTAPLYGLVRCFAGEPLLLGLGGILLAYPLLLALLARAAREVLSLGLAAALGVPVLAAGVGEDLSLAAATASGFALCLGATLAALCLEQPLRGPGRLPALALALAAAFSLAGLPGSLGYAANGLLLDGIGRDGDLWVWGLAVLALAAAPLHVGARWLGLAWRAPPPAPPEDDLAAAAGRILLAVFVLVNGVNPGWLFALLPPNGVPSAAYAGTHALALGQLVLAAMATWGLLQALRVFPKSRLGRSSDMADWIPPLAVSLRPLGLRLERQRQNLLRLVLAWTKLLSPRQGHEETGFLPLGTRNSHSPLLFLCFVAVVTVAAWLLRSP